MTFEEALEEYRKGKKIRRLDWKAWVTRRWISKDSIKYPAAAYLDDGGDELVALEWPTWENILSNDWESE